MYNNIGAYKERIPEKEHYMKVFEHEVNFNKDDKALLTLRFTKMLDYIIGHTGTGTRCDAMDVTITIPPLYNFIFNSSHYDRELWAKIHARIKPFCLYFPQFHRLEENDVNYYPGMTDIKNLIEHIKDGNAEKLDSPDLTTLGIGSLEEYDLSNPALVTRQIDIAKEAGICGFCIYYYWFSTNTITNRNSIMERCYDNFFKEELSDFKVFFNWANEDWINTTNVKITNTYTNDMFSLNIENLSKYFLHKNYYKIDNRPVFLIHHPWFIGSNIKQLHDMLDKACINLGFTGIYIIQNSILTIYNPGFLHAPNYKDGRLRQYIDQIIRPEVEEIKTLFFSFNNTARTYKPKKPHMTKIYASQTEHKSITEKIISSYLNSKTLEINKILLINSWNECGEDMTDEPGLLNKSFYLNLIKSALLPFLCNNA